MRCLLLLLWICPVLLCAEEDVRVLDAQGLPVAGARVEWRGRVVTVTAPGFEAARERVEPGTPVVIRLRPAMVRTSVDVVVREEAGGATEVGSSLSIERTGARTVFDAVEQAAPGVSVTRRGAMGYGVATNGTGGVSIRGIGESPNTGVLVIVDGRPDFQGMMGHPLPDFYSLSDAGSVRVIEGPASVLYGSNAMGGVVEVKNWEPPEGITTRLSSSFGSYYTGQHRLAHGARLRRGFYSLNAGVAHTKGDRRHSAFRDQDGTVTAGYDLSSVWKASVDGRYGHFYVEDPAVENSYARVGRGGFSINLDNATAATWGHLRAYSSYGNHYLSDGFHSTDRTTGLRADQQAALGPRLLMEFGGDVVNYGGQARNYGQYTLTSAAGFARAQWTATRRLRLNSGVRYEHNSLFGSTVVPEFGAAFTVAEGYTVTAEAGRGFRNPTIRELYLFPAPNPALKPEHVWNYQATVQAHPAKALSVSLTGYYASLDNLVATTGRYPNLKLLNTGAALNRGIETRGRWRAHRRIAVQSGHAWLRSTNMAPYVPGQKFNYGIDIDTGRAFVYVGGMSVSRRKPNLAGYTLGSLKITLPVSRRWRLSATVDNLFNRRYEVVTGYPMPGVNATGGFTVGF